MKSKAFFALAVAIAGGSALLADDPRPIPLTRPEMKQLIEDMKQRKPRIPLPELTAEDKEKLGDRGMGYEGRLRYHYMGGETPRPMGGSGGGGGGNSVYGFGANPDNTLDNTFKVQLFWIVCRTNNCQYCQGHQESKLLRAGQTEDQIAALDGDWSDFPPAQQAAFAFARKFTYEPHKLADADIDALRKHYKDQQILEMVLSMAGNNAINRWKEGAGVPQNEGSGGFGRGGAPVEPGTKHTYLTPTADKNKETVTKVAPLVMDDKSGKPTRKTVFTRAPLESREEVEKALAAARKRMPRLPLVDEAKAREALPADWSKDSLPQWVRLLANTQGKNRIVSQRTAEEKGDLKPLLKAQASWIIARQDRAWYAVGQAKSKLLGLGQTEDQVYKLDGDWKDFTPTEQAMFTVAKKLAASPVVLTDDDVAAAVKLAGPRDVVQLINYVTVQASFDRITEAAGLQIEK
jgi:alkylhydroperoxidase family enzyme